MPQTLTRYDPSKTYLWNYEHAPQPSGSFEVPAVDGRWTFCGRPVPSPLGVAAGPLLNGRWVLYYAELGFDVLTYKTTRSSHRECYPLPNLQPIESTTLARSGQALRATSDMQGSWAISFGMPSMSPDVWRADVEWTRDRLPKDKLLTVSVVASAQPGWSIEELAQDFAQCAHWALDSGADCVETNFSCPNVDTCDGQLFQQPTVAGRVAQCVREAIGAAPYLIKIGLVNDSEIASQLLDAVAPFADALAMTNCIAAQVSGLDNVLMFDEQPRGIGGDCIRAASVHQVSHFFELARNKGYATRLIGVGGISAAQHVREYLSAGAEAVQLATAAMVDPLVGLRIREELRQVQDRAHIELIHNNSTENLMWLRINVRARFASTILLPFLWLSVLVSFTSGAEPLPRLKVSENLRHLMTADGKPFFWLGDTAWELFHRLNREEVDKYLTLRADQGYSVIQAVALAELDGHTDPNPYGHLPLVELDPARPAVVDGPNNDYWDHVDYIVDAANSRGLYIGFLPTWGRYWHDTIREERPLFTPANAEAYGKWLGTRYKEKGLVWILGGDRAIENDEQREIIRAMARGLRQADGGAHLMTFHPPGGRGSAEWFHTDDWLDFNMRQNGHVTEFTERYAKTREDYDRTPTKPVIDGEPIYEDHPVSFNPDNLGHSTSADVRRPLYWNLFSGACGHTYGHHSVWQMWREGRNPINRPLMPWNDAIHQPGAAQMQFGRQLLESRPQPQRIPDKDIIVTDLVASSVPGAGRYRFAATRDANGTYALIYVPVGRKFRVRMDKISGPMVKAWWYNPRNGRAESIGEFPNTGEREFISPAPGEQLDWILVLDDAGKQYPAPGAQR